MLACLLAAGAALAARPAATIRLHSERGVPFAVLLDGLPLTRGLVRQARAERLAPGMHYVDFSVPMPRGRSARLQSRIWLEPGYETTFVLLARPGRPLALQPAGAVALYRPGYGVPGQHRHYGRGSSFERNDYSGSYGAGHDEGPYRGQSYPDDANQQAPDQPYPAGTAGGYDQAPAAAGPGRYYPGSANTSTSTNAYAVLAAPEVDALGQALSRAASEDEQLWIARQRLNNRRIYAEDLAQLLRSLRSDQPRIELATFAYPLVEDRQNFHVIYPAFTYRAAAREVQEAVSR